MMESIQQELREDFLGSSLDAYVDLTYLWGIDGVDRTGFDMFGTNSYRGSPVYSSFDLFQESSQRSVLEACDEMMSWTCDAKGCASAFGTLLRIITRMSSVSLYNNNQTQVRLLYPEQNDVS